MNVYFSRATIINNQSNEKKSNRQQDDVYREKNKLTLVGMFSAYEKG